MREVQNMYAIIPVNFSALAKKGQKAFLASLITSILLMCFAAGVAALFF